MRAPSKLSQNIKAREDESGDEPYSDELAVSSPSVLDTGEGDGSIISESQDDPSDIFADGRADAEDSDINTSPPAIEAHNHKLKHDLSTISFGALSQAQDSLGKRKRPILEPSAANLDALRSRLRELKRRKTVPGPKTTPSSAPSAASASRSSHHAPSSQSSKKAVTRKRTVFAPPKPPTLGDPRFSALTARPDAATAARAQQHYAFLKEYRDAEISELRGALDAASSKSRASTKSTTEKKKKTKKQTEGKGVQLSDEAATTLSRKLASLESKKRADEERERREQVLRAHKRQEREAVRAGKKPFFLKEAETRRRVLVGRFEGMGRREVERVVERRRRKEGERERRGMPGGRRSAAARGGGKEE